MPSTAIRIALGPQDAVSGLVCRPDSAAAAYVFAHGAGAGMTHAFMAALAHALASAGVATLRYQFPYMERGSRRPDAPAAAHAAVRAAVAAARVHLPGLPLFAGGKSFGARMTSQAQAHEPLAEVRGLAFVGFPLHPEGQPAVVRAQHLASVAVPMLFLQGTRDALADLRLLESVVEPLRPRATLRLVDDADHAFHVRARSGRDDAAVVVELATAMAAWFGAH